MNGPILILFNLLHQIHSTRIKAAVELARANIEDVSEEDLVRLEEHRFAAEDSPGAEVAGERKPINVRIEAVIVDACLALRECRRLDQYDFKSVYRIASIAYKLSYVDSLRNMQLPGVTSVGVQGALDEISKLFDKKRYQIVAIWCVVSTANRCFYG